MFFQGWKSTDSFYYQTDAHDMAQKYLTVRLKTFSSSKTYDFGEMK